MAESYIVNYNLNPAINNIEHSDIEHMNMFSKRIVFYNPEVDEPLHKFWYYLPKVKIINIDKNNIRIVFSNKDKIMTSVNSLDECVDGITQKIFGCEPMIARSITTRPNYPPTMDLTYDVKTKFFDQINKKIDASHLDNGMNAMMYIEFDQIVVTSHGFFRKWRIVQMKSLKNSIVLSENLFEEVQNLPQPSEQMGRSIYHSIPIPPPYVPPLSPINPINPINLINHSNEHPNTPSNATNNNFPQPITEIKKDKHVPVEFIAPTREQLTNMLGRLKKKSDTKIIPPNHPNDRKDGLVQIMNEIIIKKELMEIDRNNKLIKKYIDDCDLLCRNDNDLMKYQIDTFTNMCRSMDRIITPEDTETKYNSSTENSDDDDPFSLPYEGPRR